MKNDDAGLLERIAEWAASCAVVSAAGGVSGEAMVEAAWQIINTGETLSCSPTYDEASMKSELRKSRYYLSEWKF